MTARRQTKLFGLHKATVEKFLKKLDQSHAEELFHLKIELEDLSQKNKKLEENVANLQADFSQQTSNGVLTKAIEGLPSILGAIHAQVAKDTDNLRLKSEEEFQTLDQAIHKLKVDIQKGTRLFDTFILQFSKGIEDLGHLPETLLLDNKMDVDSSHEHELEELPLDESEINVPLEQPLLAPFSSFWEGSERVLTQPIPPLTKGREKSRGQDQSSQLTKEREVINDPPVDSMKREDQSSDTNAPFFTSIQASISEEEKGEPSEGIKQEIDLIKRRYIVGKVAGSTLYDQNGHLIVEKGKQITDAVVDQANKTGQLSDLIVHMRIPGLGE